MHLELTIEEIVVVAEKLDDIALIFTGAILDEKRKSLYIRTLCQSTMVGMIPQNFAHLCTALDRTMERWKHPGQMPTPHFMLETISNRTA